MEEEGVKASKVLAELKERLKEDATYSSGRILGSMCTKPHPLARKVFYRYMEKNLGDPGLFKATAEIEREAVSMLAKLLHCPSDAGFIVSGGTEANILALWSAREATGRRKVIAPATAHASIAKAASMLRMELIEAPVTEDGAVDVGAVERLASQEVAAVVGVAGSTDLGSVDPIRELSEVSLRHGAQLHVDAAFGGLVLPFLRELGYPVPDFDFKVPGVCSVTVDPHKMGMAPIPAGGILFRSWDLAKPTATYLPYLSGGGATLFTLTGTRPGASALAVWALFKHLGREGYRKVVAKCMELTSYLANEVEKVDGARLVRRPLMNVVGIAFDNYPAEAVASKLRQLGWAVSTARGFLRIVVMPHVRRSHVDRFIRDLRRTLREPP
ncbi:MAG: tyrosine decarboxylase MfnA [Candidatus Nezhaarchaeota archaeon]|nr:tyrosine decarboxylase MfnA [Candidatus Nezhaarchaeota archaeon]